jgi:hypothetical protein
MFWLHAVVYTVLFGGVLPLLLRAKMINWHMPDFPRLFEVPLTTLWL